VVDTPRAAAADPVAAVPADNFGARPVDTAAADSDGPREEAEDRAPQGDAEAVAPVVGAEAERPIALVAIPPRQERACRRPLCKNYHRFPDKFDCKPDIVSLVGLSMIE
ncbi:MAG: hypothetical protein ACREDR_47215, partial [Blastocatellia bacterium]